MIRTFLLAVCLTLCAAAGARAQVTCTVPITLQNGSLADATQVMNDLNAIAVCINNFPSAYLSPIANFGCVGNGIVDDTSCMQTALNSAGSTPIYLGQHLYKIGAITMPPYAKIMGSGMGSYAGANLGVSTTVNCTSGFVPNAANIASLITVGHDSVLQNFCITDGAAGANSSGIAINMEANCDSSATCPQSYSTTVDHVLIDQACIDIALSGNFHNITNNTFGRNTGSSCGNIRVGHMTNSNRTIQPNIYNNNLYTSFGTIAQYALKLEDAGGPYITNNEINHATYNLWVNPGLDASGANGAQNVQAINSSGNYYDTPGSSNVYIDCQTGSFGVSNGSSTFNGDWFGSAASSNPGIVITTTGAGCHAIGLQFDNVRIDSVHAADGIDLNSANVWNVSIANSHICTGGTNGIKLASGVGIANQGITITGNTVGGTCDGMGQTMTNGFNLGGTNADLTIVGNDFSQGTTNAYASGSSPGGNSLVANNKGIDDVAASLSSGALASPLPLNSVVLLSGTSATSIPASTYCCPRKTFITTGGAVSFTGGAISDPLTSTLNVPVIAQFTASNWFLK